MQWRHNFVHMGPSSFFDVALFLLWNLVVRVSYRHHYLFWSYKNFCLQEIWIEIWKLKIPPSQFCPLSGDWINLVISNLAWMFLMKRYFMLQNARFSYRFYHFWVISGKSAGGFTPFLCIHLPRFWSKKASHVFLRLSQGIYSQHY